MKKGIGPQFLGAGGMNPKSTPCGHSVDAPTNFNATLRKEVGKGTLNPGFENAIRENDPALGDSPTPFLGGLAGGFAAAIGNKPTMLGSNSPNRIAAAQGAMGTEPTSRAVAADAGGGSAGMGADIEALQSKVNAAKGTADRLSSELS